MTVCDVVVIGAGIAGTSLAYELQAYADVILIERDDRPGCPASGHATVSAPSHGNRVVRALSAASRPFLDERLAGLVERPVLAPRGSLVIARADQTDRLEAFHDTLRPVAPALEALQAEAVLARVPELRPGYAIGGMYDPDGCDIDAALIQAGYLDGFRHRGGRLITGAELLAIEGAPAQWELRTRAGRLGTPMIVDAAGAWADVVADLAGLPPLGLHHCRDAAFVFESSIDLPPERPLVIDTDGAFSFRPEARLVLGTSSDPMPPPPPPDAGPQARDVTMVGERVERATRLRVQRVVRRWAGINAFSPDGVPVVGMDERMPGFFWFAGMGGHGVQAAPALARAGAGLLVDGVVPDDLLARGVTADDLMPLRLLRGTAGGAAAG